MLNKIKKPQFFLRGGGCGISKNNFVQQSDKNVIQADLDDFLSRFNHYVQIIESKASVAANQQESSEIMIAIKWFIFQEENIYKINKNVQSVKKSYDLILDGIRLLLKSCLTYVRSDSFKCLYILQVTASLSKVIFSFHLTNDERFMKCETQNHFLEICDELQQQMEIEKNDLIQNQLELFLFLTKTSFEIAPNNSKEKEEILKGSLKGIISSLTKMSLETELLESLFQGACLLYKMQDISKKRKQYEVFYQIDMLQWEIISYFKSEKQKNLIEIILQIEAIYETIVKSSKNWREHYFWILMIGKILVYNPLLTKKRLGQLNNSQNVLNVGEKSISQIWKDYNNRGLLIQMNHSNDLAVIQLKQLQNNNITQLDRLMLEDSFKGWEDFLILKQILMDEQNENTQYTFSAYLKCKLDLFRTDLQKNGNILTMEKMQKLLSFIVSTKLINLIKKNDEKLGEVIKIQKQFMEDEQVNTRLLKITVHSLFKKIVCNLEEYLINSQYILKIFKLNQNNNQFQTEQFNQEKINELNNLQQLKYLMRLLEQILLQAIQNIKNNRNQFCIQNEEIKMLQQEKELIQVELQNLNLKDTKFLFVNEFQQKLFALPIATLNLKSFLKEALNMLKLIENSQKQIQNLEIIQLQKNNVVECFQNLLHNLYCFYEHKNEDLQKDLNEFILSFKTILILQCEIESVSQTEQFVKIKQQFSTMLSFQYIFNQKLKNLKLKLQLIAFKESFLNILAAHSEEIQQLQEVINLDQFLINVINNYPKRIISCHGDICEQTIAELTSMQINEEDYQNKLFIQQGIIEYLIFRLSLVEQMIDSERIDLELIEKEFGVIYRRISFFLFYGKNYDNSRKFFN